VDDKVVSEIIDLNVVAATQMTRLVLPGMVKKRAGAVVNIGSAASVLECGNPMYSVYSASKAYVDALSRSLYYELKGIPAVLSLSLVHALSLGH
jgi:17beta-estradiol 17-dehydrogenase / very-long-chain 3-oxoacyl-CoA reductase